LGEGLVEKLKAAGVNTVESLADMTPEQLEAIEGIGPKTVEKISIAVNNYFAGLDGGEAVAAAESDGTGEVATEATSGEEPLAEASVEEGSVEADALAADGETGLETASTAEGVEPETEEAASEAAATEEPVSAEARNAESATEQEAPEDKQS
jgi:N utilization substance protein A